MITAIKVIRQEHAGLAAIYRTLNALLLEVKEGKRPPDYAIFRELVEYLKSFIYRFHHPKENDYLFPALREKSPEAASLIDKLEAQHKEGGELLMALDGALSRYEMEGDAARDDFLEMFDRFHKFEWEHMSLEEKEILPLASKVLTDSDWEAINSAFTDHSDPLFGDKRRSEFQRLFDHIAKTIPAPHGLGD